MQRPLDFGETLYYVRNLPLGNHGSLFYRSANEKHEMAFNFLQAGFEKEEGAVYIASHETPKQIRRRMEEFGWDVKALEKDGALQIFDCEGWYIVDGEVNVPHIMTRGSYVFDEAMEIGLKGLRGWGETACFFEHGKVRELVEYELLVGRRFDLPMTALCAYDVHHAKSLDVDSFADLLRAHGPIVTHSFAQEVKFEDFFSTIMNETLETIFGEIGKDTILEILVDRLSLTPHEIAECPNVFFERLEAIVGSGAQVVTQAIVTRMYDTIGITKR